MAVAYQTVQSVRSFGGSPITTPALTFSGANLAAALIFMCDSGSNPTGITGSVGAVSTTIVTGSDSGTTTAQRGLIHTCAAPVSGNTASIAWTGGAPSVQQLACIVASGVDQGTIMNGGTFQANTTTGSAAHSITSTSGDLAVSGGYKNGGAPNISTDQAAGVLGLQGSNFGVTYGAGTGTATHTWTGTATDDVTMTGANFVQVAAGPAAQPYQPWYNLAPMVAQ